MALDKNKATKDEQLEQFATFLWSIRKISSQKLSSKKLSFSTFSYKSDDFNENDIRVFVDLRKAMPAEKFYLYNSFSKLFSISIEDIYNFLQNDENHSDKSKQRLISFVDLTRLLSKQKRQYWKWDYKDASNGIYSPTNLKRFENNCYDFNKEQLLYLTSTLNIDIEYFLNYVSVKMGIKNKANKKVNYPEEIQEQITRYMK